MADSDYESDRNIDSSPRILLLKFWIKVIAMNQMIWNGVGYSILCVIYIRAIYALEIKVQQAHLSNTSNPFIVPILLMCLCFGSGFFTGLSLYKVAFWYSPFYLKLWIFLAALFSIWPIAFSSCEPNILKILFTLVNITLTVCGIWIVVLLMLETDKELTALKERRSAVLDMLQQFYDLRYKPPSVITACESTV